MAIEVIMPVLGLTMTQGKIARWLKNEGDPVKKGEPLLEIATDKIVTEVESPGEGILVKIIHQKDAVVPVTELIAIIAAAGENYDQLLEKASPAPSAKVKAVSPVQGEPKVLLPSEGHLPLPGDRLKVSPLARKVAAENNLTALELSTIKGSGPDGRIVKKDVICYLKNRGGEKGLPLSQEAKVEPLSNLRATIAERMSQSWKVPHFYLQCEVDAGNLMAMRAQINARLNETDRKVSLTDVLVKVAACALQHHPAINVSFTPEGIVYKGEINIGVAVAIDDGLIVPVIRNCNFKNIRQIAAENKEIIGKAKAGRLTMDDVSGGTFTISNLGMFAVESFTAILNPPEAAILATGNLVKKPVAESDRVVVKDRMTITLGLDHRAIDGATGARFLSELKEIIENPYLMI